MPLRTIAFALWTLTLAAAPATAGDLSTMYERSTVAQAQERLRSKLVFAFEQAFKPKLRADELRQLSGVTIESPVTADPVGGYYSNYKTRTVTMSATSLVFFEDLTIAYAWLQVNNYRLETIEEYLSMLKYKDAQAFGGRYPAPLKALGIPADAVKNPKVDDLSLRLRNSGYAFILGHELGHIRFQHKFYNEVPPAVAQANESEADAFGIDLMARVSEIPMGGLLFFQSGIYYFPNRADVGSDAEWRTQLAKMTHPLTSDRLQKMAAILRDRAADFGRGKPNPSVEADIARSVGTGVAKLGADLDDVDQQRRMRATAERSAASSLLPRRTRDR